MRSYLNQAITICNAELQHEGSRLGRLEDWNSNPRRVSNYCPGPVAAMIEKWPIVNLFLLCSKYAFLRRWGIEIPNNCSIVLKPIFIFDAHWEHFFLTFPEFRVAPLSSKMIMTILLDRSNEVFRSQVHSHFFYSNLQLWRRWMQKTDIFSGQHWEKNPWNPFVIVNFEIFIFLCWASSQAFEFAGESWNFAQSHLPSRDN